MNSTGPAGTRGATAGSRTLLALAAIAIAFAAADTYVVVLALPDMMASTGLDIDQLQRAAPILSGFLLGYVGILPLIGRISDLRGRVPVLLGSLAIFALGSLVTAVAYNLDSMVIGRFIQGMGGGGLIPPTLALVADTWPPARRGLPLGVIGAVQELGSVLGPLYGAAVLAFGDWRDIFWLNGAIGLILAAAMLRTRTDIPRNDATTEHKQPDLLGALLLALILTVLTLVMAAPDFLTEGIDSGRAFLPVQGDSRWLTPLALALYLFFALFILREALAQRPLFGWRGWGEIARETDLIGALLMAIGLGAVIIAFASAEPESNSISANAPILLPIALAAAIAFAWRQKTARAPLIPRRALAHRAAWGSMIVSFFIGAALIAALVDIPFFARLTIYPDSQLDAALVLVRFLVALPIGALLGGWLLRYTNAAALTTVAMTISGFAFVHMATWNAKSLEHPIETLSLIVAGIGFGLAIAPINAVLLEVTDDAVHGVASGFLIVARMVGMLIGISALTTIGLHRFYAASSAIPPATDLCNGVNTACNAYKDALLGAGISQLHAVFAGAAVCAFIAAVLASILLRPGRLSPTTQR